MSSPQAPARRVPRTVLLTACLAAAVGGGSGCGGFTIAPADPAWTVTDGDDAGRATWRAADVEVAVPLHYGRGATLVSADVRNTGPAAAKITFGLPAGSIDGVPVGSVSGGPPTFDRTWTESVFPGRPIDVPPGTAESPATLHFALRPDTRWSAESAPSVGSGITLDLRVTSKSGSAACPFRFRVKDTSAGGGTGLSDSNLALIVLILAVVALGIIAFSGGGSSDTDLDHYPMGE